MRPLASVVVSFFTAASLCSCGGTTHGPPAPLLVDEARSNSERLPPDASLDVVRTLAKNNSAFAIDLLRVIPDKGNVFYSPHSISTALAMTYAGAAGTTKEQMREVLHYAQHDAELNAAFNTLDQKLESRGQGARASDGQPFRLRLANAVWAQRGEFFLPTYLDTLAQDYGAGVSLLDFVSDTEGSRRTINAWVAKRTEERIPSLLPEGVLNRDTRLVLTNAVYFNAAWAEPFDHSKTKDGPFTRADESIVTVPLMHGMISGRYAETIDYQAAEIPYDGGQVAMLAILPKAQKLEAFEPSLDAEKLAEIVGSFQGEAKLDLTLPRFQIRTPLALAEVLNRMGMPAAFTPGQADFSKMDGSRELYLQNVVHEAFVNVNEEGTEAAAATAVIVGRTSMPEVHTFEATRPFLFLVRDIETGAVVFLGRVTDPSH